jgi:hypothetical protein
MMWNILNNEIISLFWKNILFKFTQVVSRRSVGAGVNWSIALVTAFLYTTTNLCSGDPDNLRKE